MNGYVVDHLELRKEFNSKIKPKYIDSHTPQCQKCMRFSPWKKSVMEVHHKHALIDGGTNDIENLITLCHDCHEEWHKHEDTGIPFSEWMQRVPLRVYAAIGMTDDIQMKKRMLSEIDELWPAVRDKIMVSEPWNDENREYTNKNCCKWVDW